MKLNSIQFFRALAAIMVLLVHTRDYFVPVNFEYGRFGVDIFFVLSGFVMAFIHHERAEKIKNFTLKRIVRIYPTYLEVLLIAILIFGAKKFDIGANLLFTDYDANSRDNRILGVSWTLSYEFWFYFVFGISMMFFKRKFYTGIWIFLFATLANMIFFKENFWLSWRNLEFCSGVALCYFLRNEIISLDEKIKFPKIIILIGDASYSLYLLHIPLFYTLGRFLHKFTSTNILAINLFWYLVFLVATISISILNHLFFEKKIINFFRK